MIVEVVVEVPLGRTLRYSCPDRARVVARLSEPAPGNYGIIPRAHSVKGLGCLVLGSEPVSPCSVLPARVIGALKVEANGVLDDEIIAVEPWSGIKDLAEVPEETMERITRFIEAVKTQEFGGTVKFKSTKDKEKAAELVKKCVELYRIFGE